MRWPSRLPAPEGTAVAARIGPLAGPGRVLESTANRPSLTVNRRRHGPPGTRNSRFGPSGEFRSEEHTSELQSLMRISYAVICLKTKNEVNTNHTITTQHTNQ